MSTKEDKLDEILDSFGDDVEVIRHHIDTNTVKPAEGYAARSDIKAQAKLEIDKLFKERFLELVGEDLPTDMYGSWTRRPDGKMILLSDEIIVTNNLKAKYRKAIEDRYGDTK